MANLHETIDSLNDENVSEVKETLKKEAAVLDKSNKQLHARAKKAEGFERKDGKWVKKEKPKEVKPDTKPKNPKAKQPDEPDYALDAFLEGRDIKTPDDKKLIKDEMARLKLPAGDILDMKHIKAQLKDAKDQREAESGMPEGGNSKAGGNKGSVDYWIDRKDKDGNYITPSDTKLANEVIDARLKADKENNMFSDDLHN